MHSANPFGVTVPGSVLRQRDLNVNQAQNPNVTRGYGIYRRSGGTVYIDLGAQFADHNLLEGSLTHADAHLSVEQLQPSAGACTRR